MSLTSTQITCRTTLSASSNQQSSSSSSLSSWIL